jgi:hypothetical protein
VSKNLGRAIMRIIFVFYMGYLTVLLMSQDPTKWIGAPGALSELLKILEPVAHLLSFGLLSFLACAAFFPMPRWGVMCFLGLYGGAIEIIQAAVPHRHAQWTDWLQDLCGIFIGFFFFWLVMVLVRMFRGNNGFRVSGSS